MPQICVVGVQESNPQYSRVWLWLCCRLCPSVQRCTLPRQFRVWLWLTTTNNKRRVTGLQQRQRQRELYRTHQSKRTPQMSTSAQSSSDRQRPPKLDVDEYLTTAISATPSDLHPFFEAFQNLYSRKYARHPLPSPYIPAFPSMWGGRS